MPVKYPELMHDPNDWRTYTERLEQRVDELEGFVRDLRQLASEVTALSNDAVERWCTDVLGDRR